MRAIRWGVICVVANVLLAYCTYQRAETAAQAAIMLALALLSECSMALCLFDGMSVAIKRQANAVKQLLVESDERISALEALKGRTKPGVDETSK